MRFIKNIIKGIVESFPPQDFKGNWYYWIMNQFSHTCMTYFACIYSCLISEYSWIAFVVFWFLWEVRHYKISKNKLDFIEDLYFEWSGIGLFLLGSSKHAYMGGLVYTVTLITLAIKKRIKWDSHTQQG